MLHGPSRARRAFNLLLALYPLALLGLCAVHALAPQRQGLLAVSQIGVLYVFLPLLLLVPWAWNRHARLLRWLLIVCGVVFLVRFGPSLMSFPQRAVPDATPVRVLSWNVLYSNFDQLEPTLLNTPADVVALQECVPRHHDILANSAALRERYPHQFFAPQRLGHDTCLLSVYPIMERGSDIEPSLQWARLDLGDGDMLMVVNTHLQSATFHVDGYVPTLYEPSIRDRQITRLRAVIDPLLQQNEPVLLVGDFNTTEHEVAYADLARGLTDAHRAVGWGTGHSWRPEPGWPFGVIRIDYQWGSPRVVPMHLQTDCTPHGSDHCLVQGDFAVQ